MTTAATHHPKTAIASTIADFKGLADWIEVFRAGTHVDSKGVERTFSQADLDQMAANQAVAAAPAVLGHPKHNDPAYAWTESVKREGDSLFVKFRDINPDFERAVELKAYTNRSLSVMQDKLHGWRIRHVGWLGAVAPALDGLKPVEFADADADVIEFMGDDDAVRSLIWATQGVASLFRGFREYLIEQSGVEVADRVVPGWQIDSLTSSAERATAAMDADTDDQPAYQAPTPNGGQMATQEELDKIKADAKAEAEAAAAAKFAAQGAELGELRQQRKDERIGTQINAWKAAGLVTPAEEPGLREFMGVLEDAAVELTFSAGEGQGATEVKKAPKDWFAHFMATRKPLVRLGKDGRMDEVVDDQTSDDPVVVAAKAQNYMAEQAKAGITVSLPEAVAMFSKKTTA